MVKVEMKNELFASRLFKVKGNIGINTEPCGKKFSTHCSIVSSGAPSIHGFPCVFIGKTVEARPRPS
jgi:hypothetical protein